MREREDEETRREITERERAEAAYSENQQQFELLVQSIDGIVCEMDGHTFQVTFVNKAAEKILGYPLEQWTGEPTFWIDHLHPEDRDWAVKAKTQATAERENRQLEYRMIAADGRVVWLRDILTVWVTRDQQVLLRGVKIDVTERRRAEDELRRQKEILQKIFDHIPVMISFFDEEGRLKLANREWERRRGWSLKEIEQQNLDIFAEIYPDPQERQKARDAIAAATGAWTDFHTITKDGQAIDTAWAVIRLSDGTSISIGQDITERKRAVREIEKLLHQLGERVKELTALHGAAGILQEAGAVTEELLRKLAELLPPTFQYPEMTSARIRLGPMEAVTPGFAASPCVLRADFTTADAQPGSVEVFYRKECPPADEGPFLLEERALLRTLADMLRTSYDRWQTELALRESEKQLRASSQQLRALTASLTSAREEEGIRIAREIHDELGSALTSLRWDLESLDKALSEQRSAKPFKALREKIAGMMRLTDATIGSVRRISSELRPGLLDDLGLSAAIEWQAQQFQARSGITCVCDCSLEELGLNPAQATAVFRIFQEALTNILRHAQATRVDVLIKKEAGRLVLTVKDNGRGITEEEKRGARSLGLLGMRERAHLINGEINIEGVNGKGTTLTIKVPLYE